ncbi:DAACS family dicarboxylate/amino acid:cation (Na+ or H+) symporter [Methylosinus sp. sav-2]|uniref:dicarboxylate/amino acid:cation symporter n=1 Tax=Methylosinus sp. sav-2 TaxID=2485168 RepID=UPI00068F96F6|nr:dicarboxylate/amino acid:cation symporter [Methylosinus sp. sav-2]TDX67086.1 DAACS family dicarboxylate/amino acid:cation (Na+ or H+) symporter [Methylosinus sp. sav-2]
MRSKETETSAGLIAHWRAIPLYARIIVAVALGVVAGLALGDSAHILGTPAKLVLRLLGALAPPLILLAIVQALMRAHLAGGQALRLVALLLTNTLVAIFIGLAVANVLQPGAWTTAAPGAPAKSAGGAADPLMQFLDSVPKSILGPFGDNGAVMGVIFIAVAFGIALRGLRTHEVRTVEDLVHVALTSLITILHWIIDVVPLAVFGLIASIVGVSGFRDFLALGGFFIAVLTALALQFVYYALRIRLGSWASPLHVVAGVRDALLMAFSTGSSTATMPLTYELLRERVGLREQSASMGALVGSNFNNDGTALYEAMAALFVAQLLGLHLTLGQQFLVALTSVVASVGAAGIPEAGLVTMTMVFRAVALPTDYIALLLTIDWLLDRCRTAINVMGDVTVSCLLDGKTRASETRASETGEGEGSSPPPL